MTAVPKSKMLRIRSGVPEVCVAKVAGALVRRGHCAQVGENAVERGHGSVGIAMTTLDDVWAATDMVAPVPSQPSDVRWSSTLRTQRDKPAELRKSLLSTQFTALMTTSLR